MEAVVPCAKSGAPHTLFHRAWRNPQSLCHPLVGVFVLNSGHSAAHSMVMCVFRTLFPPLPRPLQSRQGEQVGSGGPRGPKLPPRHILGLTPPLFPGHWSQPGPHFVAFGT